jgi:hypothetical protein
MKKITFLIICILFTLPLLAGNNYFSKDSSGVFQRVEFFNSNIGMKDISYKAGYCYKGRLFVGIQYDFMYEYITNLIYFPDSHDLVHQIGVHLDYALLKQDKWQRKQISILTGLAYNSNKLFNALETNIAFNHKLNFTDANDNDLIYNSLLYSLLIGFEFYQHKYEYTSAIPRFAMNYSVDVSFMVRKFFLYARYTFHIPEMLSTDYLFREYNTLKFGIGYIIPYTIKFRKKKDILDEVEI